MFRKILVTMIVLALALVPMAAMAEGESYTIGFAVSTLENPFFVTMKDAAVAKAEALGVELMVLDAQDSAETQASQIEDFIVRGVDLLIINPVDSDAIGTSVVACNTEGIPVITVTRASNSGEVVQHLDIDNREAGRLDAEQLIVDLGGTGKVAVLEGIAGYSSAIERNEGFVAALEGTEIEIVASLTANYAREEGASVTEDILQANPELDAIYAHNDEMALGAVRAVAAAGRSEEIKIYGIDATDDALVAVENGEMAATVQQQPDLQIETALENAITYLEGGELEPMVCIPLKLIVKE